MPIFVEIAQTTEEICQFSIFQDGGRRHFGFWKFQIFNVWAGQKGRTARARARARAVRPFFNSNHTLALVLAT